jgi:hypothetical protein
MKLKTILNTFFHAVFIVKVITPYNFVLYTIQVKTARVYIW